MAMIQANQWGNDMESSLVLIVDDDHDNLRLTADALSALGAEIAIATSGSGALEQAALEPPDLILMDVQMPGLDGFETCRRLKANPWTRDIPVIFMTALSAPNDKLKGLALGAVDFVTKPIHQAELLARVQVHLKIRTMAKALEEQNSQLKREVDERIAAETEQRKLAQELLMTNARLETELVERERSQRVQTALQQEIITMQKTRLAEMATPVIPITDRILVMPLIGTVDAERAQQLLSVATEGALARRAEVFIFDITGIKCVDASVAQSLVNTAAALKLLGTRVVLTGIRPDVARAFVALNIHLEAISTFSTLHDGVSHALGRFGAQDCGARHRQG